MTNVPNTCREDSIVAFLQDELSDDDVAVLERHLDSCPKCSTALMRQTAADSFWHDTTRFLGDQDLDQDSLFQDSSVQDNTGAPAGSDHSWDRLSFLDATDDPTKLGRFGGYEISGIIGRGGMGIVMKGFDVSLDRFVAIKVLNADYAEYSAPRQRFAREARAAAAVVHENVISIFGVDQWNGMPYLVMPYVKGESLQQRIDKSAPLPLEEILRISLQIARGLAAAHDQGVVHRDIKPANILMPASVSRVIITDFGLARTVDDANLTRSGVLAGTPMYMSPEQVTGEQVDGRCDLFSLGSVIYAMACGHPPFRAETPYAVLRKITDQPHRSLRLRREETPVWFSDLVDQLLQKRPNDRIRSARALASKLEESLAHVQQPSVHPVPSGIARTPSPNLRFIAGLVLMALIGIAIWCLLPWGQSQSADGSGKAEPLADRIMPVDQSQTSETDPNFPQDLDWEFDDRLLSETENEIARLLDKTAAPNVSSASPREVQ